MVTSFLLILYVTPVLLVFGVMVAIAEWLENRQ